jgi:hypothetical protein
LTGFLPLIAYNRATVEIFLNLVWVGLSLVFLCLWTRAIRHGKSELRWNTLVAVALLLILLFPVISITDDLVAMSAPAETEHDAVRRQQVPLLHAISLAILDGIALCSLGLFLLAIGQIVSVRVRPHGFASRVRAAFVSACGVRPPPATFCLAA